MTPSARLSAAITLLDQIFAGDPAERSLTRWARASRFAGSKDRAAVRDLVYDCVRRKRSLMSAGGAPTGRAVVLAHQFMANEPMDDLFAGGRFGPEPISDVEREALETDRTATNAELCDYPDFLEEELQRSLGDDLNPVMLALQERAPVDLRVNTLKTTLAEAQNYLARDLIFTQEIDGETTALRITENPRKLNGSLAYRYGFVELQDVSSQKVAKFTNVQPGARVLDYCAGGGGKTLALAALMAGKGALLAHDVNPARMKDLPERARRAGAEVEIVSPNRLSKIGLFDLVLVDAPCSGSGAWRRNPDSKWRLGLESLRELIVLQKQILKQAQQLVAPGGSLVYATCSLFSCENDRQTSDFITENPDWRLDSELFLTPMNGGDGFYAARLFR